MMNLIKLFSLMAVISLGLISCQGTGDQKESNKPTVALTPDPDNGGLTLPPGFSGILVADSLGRGRHLIVNANGDIYMRLRKENNGGTIVGLRDVNQDGRADQIEYFGPEVQGTGIDIHDGYLYYSTDSSVHRQTLDDQLVPSAAAEQVIGGLNFETQHAAKSFTFDGNGGLYLNFGAPSNACMEQSRTAGSPGIDPCPLLEEYGGIWRFNDSQSGQTQLDNGHRYATGLRNCVALTWNPMTSTLFAVQHGRDDLHRFWEDLYTAEQNLEVPAEELVLINDGDDFGWPYCYYDNIQNKKVLNPEYGGDGGNAVGRCADKKDPLIGLPAHYGPNDIVFYDGQQFPESYSGGAFIAFHGSWNRLGSNQEGYQVIFVPFEGNTPNGDWTVFADNFKGGEIASPSDAVARPTGLAIGPDGSLYISDSVQGKIWRIFYTGQT